LDEKRGGRAEGRKHTLAGAVAIGEEVILGPEGDAIPACSEREVGTPKLCCCMHIGRESDHLVTLVATLLGTGRSAVVAPLAPVVALQLHLEARADIELSARGAQQRTRSATAPLKRDERDGDRILELTMCTPRGNVHVDTAAVPLECHAALHLAC